MDIYSGHVRLCATGLSAGFKDMAGNDLFTGDIVYTYSGSYTPQHFTVVVADEDGPYVMGIKSVDMESPGEWRVIRLKSHEHVIAGENWPAWGFSYKTTATDGSGA